MPVPGNRVPADEEPDEGLPGVPKSGVREAVALGRLHAGIQGALDMSERLLEALGSSVDRATRDTLDRRSGKYN